jgi:FkbM family methyltransferase
MDHFLRFAPEGNHLAFEPISEMASALSVKYQNKKVKVLPYALSNYRGKSSFNLVVTNPAYSGLKKRDYDRVEKDKMIEIDVACLDDFVDTQSKIDLIKIDVEGGELDVIRGGMSLLDRDHPVLIFEHGKGSAEHYESGPENIFDFLTELGYKIYTLDDFLATKKSILRDEFIHYFEEESEYYFVAK